MKKRVLSVAVFALIVFASGAFLSKYFLGSGNQAAALSAVSDTSLPLVASPATVFGDTATDYVVPSGSSRSLTINNLGNVNVYVSKKASNFVTVSNVVPVLTASVSARLSPNSPAARSVSTSPTQKTTDVVLGVFSLKSANAPSVLKTLKVSLVGTITTDPSISSIKLFDGATSYSGYLASGVVTFTNLNISLARDSWKDLTIKTDVSAKFVGNANMSLSANNANVVVMDASNKPVLVETSTSVSTPVTFVSSGLTVSNTSATLGSAIMQTNVTTGYNVSYKFTLTNTSNNDLYVSAMPSVMIATTTNGTLGASAIPTILSVSPSSYNGDTTGATAAYVIPAGVSRTFTLAGAIRGASGQAGVNLKVKTIYYGTTPTVASSQGTASSIVSGLDNLSLTASF